MGWVVSLILIITSLIAKDGSFAIAAALFAIAGEIEMSVDKLRKLLKNLTITKM